MQTLMHSIGGCSVEIRKLTRVEGTLLQRESRPHVVTAMFAIFKGESTGGESISNGPTILRKPGKDFSELGRGQAVDRSHQNRTD